MQELRKTILKLWGLFSFAEKVAMVAVLVGLVVFALCISFAAVAYKADKEAYLFEMQMLRARSAATQLRAALAESRAVAQPLAQGSALPATSSLGITRVPEGDEIFLTATAALFRSPKGDLLSAPILPPPIPEEDGVVFAATTDGHLVAASGKGAPTVATLASRTSLKLALKSGLTESTTTFELNGRRMALAHTEIPNTNIMVFAEMPINRLMAPSTSRFASGSFTASASSSWAPFSPFSRQNGSPDRRAWPPNI